MSDRSSYSGSESEDNQSYHGQYSDEREESDRVENDSESEQSGDERDSEPGAEAGGVVETTSIVGNNNLKLCLVHKAGSMTLDCKHCKAALGLITDVNIKTLLTQNSSHSGLVSRYAGRCDEQTPTLTLGAASLEIGQSIFTKGVFKDRKSWQQIVKQFLTLPQAQHELLTVDIKTEDIISKYKNEKRFQYIFRFQKDIVDIQKNLRLSQRPLLSLIEKNHEAILSVRQLGGDAGLTFPVVAPVKVGGTVPREGHELSDQLHVDSSDGLFPSPDLETLINSAGLNELQAQKVVDFIDGFNASVRVKYMELFNVTSKYVNVAEDQLVFYTDLYSHVDASLREVLREKMASLFRSHIKSDILKQTSSKHLAGKPGGLFGGNKKMGDVIGASTKKNSVLDKAILPKKSYKKETKSSPKRSRTHSRSRSPSPRKSDRGHGSSSRYYRKRKSSASGSGKNGKNSGGSDKNGGDKEKRAKADSRKKD